MGQEIVNYSEEWAKQAESYATQEKLAGGLFLSTKGGILKCDDVEFPGNQACVIVLDAVRENTYYPEKFDPDNSAAPTCYAFGRGDEEMAPHESMQQHPEYFIPQHESCDGCPHAEWGSADTGRGKACQNRRRLALLPAGNYVPKRGSRDFDLELFDDPKHFQTADIAYLKLPVGSVRKKWSPYVTQVSAAHRRPFYGVITRVFVEPDPKWQHLTCFEMVENVPDELAVIIMARHEEAKKNIIQGYTPPEERETVKPGSLKGLRRGN